MASERTRQQKVLIVASVLSAALWVLPNFGLITLPLVYLNTYVHEFCHALAAMATGGDVLGVRVEASGNGLTLSQGGIGLLISSAGYVGASFIGALMVALGGSAKTARSVLLGLAVALGLGLALWVRGGPVGLLAGVFWVLTLAIAANRLQGPALTFVAQFLGVQQAMTSVLALYVLFRINVQPGIENDAANAESITGLPAIVWALIWIGISGLGLWAGFRAAWGSSRRAG